MNAIVSSDPRLLTAAKAAAGSLWSPVPLDLAEPVAAATAGSVVPVGGQAFEATFSGTASGVAVLVVDAEMAKALSESAIGSLSLVDAARGVLEAAAQTFGPVALAAVTEVAPAAGLSARPDAVIYPLTSGGEVRALLSLQVEDRGRARGGVERASYDLLMDVEMEVSAELGRTRMTVRNLLDLEPGTIVELDKMAGSPVDLLVNGRLLARGEVVVVDEEFALRITEIVATAVEVEH